MLKIGFFGTPELSASVLRGLLENENFSVEFAVTNPDKKFGRTQTLIASPVKQLAESYKIPVFQPEKIRNNTEFLEKIAEYQCDYFVVVAYGKILPKELLEIPKKNVYQCAWLDFTQISWCLASSVRAFKWGKRNWCDDYADERRHG